MCVNVLERDAMVRMDALRTGKVSELQLGNPDMELRPDFAPADGSDSQKCKPPTYSVRIPKPHKIAPTHCLFWTCVFVLAIIKFAKSLWNAAGMLGTTSDCLPAEVVGL